MTRYALIASAMTTPLLVAFAVLTFSLDWSGRAYNAGVLILVALTVALMVWLSERDARKSR